MTKKDIVNLLVNDMNFSRKKAMDFVETFFETLKSNIKEKGKLKIANFGSFEVYHKNKRIGRNPKTMERAEILERNVLRFKESSLLRKSINKWILHTKKNTIK